MEITIVEWVGRDSGMEKFLNISKKRNKKRYNRIAVAIAQIERKEARSSYRYNNFLLFQPSSNDNIVTLRYV